MTTLRQAAYGLALLAAAALLIWGTYQQSQAAQARADQAAAQIRTLEQRSTRQAQTIINLGANIAAQRLAQQSLQQTQTAVGLAQANHQVKKKEIQREDIDYREWAARPLPDTARRLQQRPALTGADGYLQLMSRRNAMRAATSNVAE